MFWEKNAALVIKCGAILAAIAILALYRVCALKLMVKGDARTKKITTRTDGGRVEEVGRSRNVWDLGLIPALEVVLHRSGWQKALAAYILVFVIVAYLLTANRVLEHLVEVSFGAVLGAMIGTRLPRDNQQEKDS